MTKTTDNQDRPYAIYTRPGAFHQLQSLLEKATDQLITDDQTDCAQLRALVAAQLVEAQDVLRELQRFYATPSVVDGLTDEEVQALHKTLLDRLVRTQDNLFTADPVYVVQVYTRIYGMSDEYTDKYAFLDDDQDEVPPHTPGARMVYYEETWDFVQAFLTQSAADHYVATQGHRHSGALRVYVDSAHRNPEWRELRACVQGSMTKA